MLLTTSATATYVATNHHKLEQRKILMLLTHYYQLHKLEQRKLLMLLTHYYQQHKLVQRKLLMLLTHYYQHHLEQSTNVAHPLLPAPQTAEKATNVAHPLLPHWCRESYYSTNYQHHKLEQKATNVAHPLLSAPQTGAEKASNVATKTTN